MIKHIKCDIFQSGADIICHQVNCQGVMGGGLAKQVREKFPNVYSRYRQLCKDVRDEKAALLGTAQFIRIAEDHYIVNLFAQNNFGHDKRYTDYNALRKCLKKVDKTCFEETIAVPYGLGCGLAGGDWNVVSKIIEEVFEDSDNTVLICEYN